MFSSIWHFFVKNFAVSNLLEKKLVKDTEMRHMDNT